jgi:hypothetical protein
VGIHFPSQPALDILHNHGATTDPDKRIAHICLTVDGTGIEVLAFYTGKERISTKQDVADSMNNLRLPVEKGYRHATPNQIT